MRRRLERWMRATGDPLLRGPIPAPPGAVANDLEGTSPGEPPKPIAWAGNSARYPGGYEDETFCPAASRGGSRAVASGSRQARRRTLPLAAGDAGNTPDQYGPWKLGPLHFPRWND